ncbi:MAG: protease modulator HflC [Phycisphaerae bacterium]|nr:protease modulator HflC [Phycisphaerae bacterium]
MKNVGIPILVLIIILVLSLMLVAFQVRETEVAFVTRLGKPVRTMENPGLYFKWPLPIEMVHKYDARLHVFEADLSETTTKGAVPIIIKSYAVWKVTDPVAFNKSVKTVAQAEAKLYSQIQDTQNRIVSQHTFSEFVNSDKSKIAIEKIQSDMLADLKSSMEAEYGIEVRNLGIKRLQVNEKVSANVFNRMKTARNRKTEATITSGQAEATKIVTDAASIRKELLAAAEGRAMAIRGQGDAEAAQFYKMLDAEPQFAIFLKNLEALKSMLKQRTTLVLPMDADPFDLLVKAPDPNTWND